MLLGSNHGEYLIDWMAHYLNPSDADAFRKVSTSMRTSSTRPTTASIKALGELSSVFKQDPRRTPLPSRPRSMHLA